MIRCDKCGFGHLTSEELRECKSWADQHHPYEHKPHACCSCGWKCTGGNVGECLIQHARHKQEAETRKH